MYQDIDRAEKESHKYQRSINMLKLKLRGQINQALNNYEVNGINIRQKYLSIFQLKLVKIRLLDITQMMGTSIGLFGIASL